MKITLIKPRLGHSEDFKYKEKAVMEPLALAIVAALTPPDIEVKLYDDRIEDIPFDEKTDLVAITVETFTAKRSYEISSEYGKRGVPVVLGGYHPSHLPVEAGQHADCVYIGDAEDQWTQLVKDFKQGKLKSLYHATQGNMQKGILPDRKIFKGKNYLPITLVQFSRGCYYNCNFCTVSTFYERNYYSRPVADVIKEIENQERKLILFVDDNITMNHQTAKELFRQLAPLKIKWFSEADINMTHDPGLMDLMQKSGCLGHLIGFESINKGSLEAMNKKPNLKNFNNYNEQLKIIRDYGLLTWAAFTIGHENDTGETAELTYEFSSKHKLLLADFNVLMPYPETALYQQLAKDNRLLYDGKWWLDKNFRFGKSAFVPYKMTVEELEKSCFNARRKFYSPGSIIKRAFDFKTNLKTLRNAWVYYLSNYLSYNDALKKQDIILGS